MTRSSDVTKYAANRRDYTIDWPHLLVLLLVPTFVSSDPILIDSESVKGNDILVISSFGWLTYAISEDIGGKQVCHKEAASDNAPPQKPDQPEMKENTAGGKKKKNEHSQILLFLKNIMLAKEFGKKTTEKLTEESTKTFLHVYLQVAKTTTMKAIDEGTKQTFEKVTQKVAVGSVTKIVQKGTEQTISGFTIRAGVTTGEKIVKEGARVTVQTSTNFSSENHYIWNGKANCTHERQSTHKREVSYNSW
ncbi:hypothetical protein GBAR_LOCUS17617 [Geodia barretti]|uniref:Uncharacterized protein n=2 Tax=Geodia barretti TaxID=519541 RepID=A0AA35WW64_GEOBA|nr:hypothetical protein GBAR_LOCUS17617 [Geodia barretti]